MSSLLPQPFWFRVAHSCRRVEGIPRPKGRLLDLGPRHELTDLGLLGGQPGWATARAGWNDGGIGFAFEVRDKVGRLSPRPQMPAGSDAVQVWIDTRDTRTVHRATRFCHRFEVTLTEGPRRAIIASVAQRTIARALANPPLHPALVEARAEYTESGYLLEVFFPAEALAGFDPGENRRFGLTYQVTDPNRGELFAGVGREFPVGDDPSLWATLVLEDET